MLPLLLTAVNDGRLKIDVSHRHIMPDFVLVIRHGSAPFQKTLESCVSHTYFVDLLLSCDFQQ